MLVIADKLKSGAEKRVVAWLRKWQDDYRVPGVAIANCFVAGQEVDLVIITPHTTVVCEVKGVNPEVTGGVLHCTSNSRWTVSGFEGDPVSVRQSDTTPYDQVREAVFKLKSVAARAGGPTFVSGLAVVVPPRETTLRLDKKSAPQGCDVLLCNTQNPLRAWFHRAHHRAAVVWTAEQAYALIEALEHGGSTTVADLAHEGFPLDVPAQPSPASPAPGEPAKPAAQAPTPSRRTKPQPEPPVPPAAVPPPPSTPPRARNAGKPSGSAPRRAPAEPGPPPRAEDQVPAAADPVPPPVAEKAPPRTDPIPDTASPAPSNSPSDAGSPPASGARVRRHIHPQTAVALAAIAVLAAGIWLLAQLGSGGTEPRGNTGQPQNDSVTEQRTPPLPSTPRVGPAAPGTEPACFPFQPNC
ncbi:nuclease-related domain-containing protein [Nocardia carnea]|uniref:nuclease-related domain-containing protein n=1 Tax=Nocardia carnea TaxID=37328 RepID=UPI002453D41A|nr:nuclease-related domain-containing protein [Nocardia carnea]